MKIIGLACGAHDTAYCVFEDGKVIIHEELERFTRQKEQQGDIFKFLEERQSNLNDVDYFSHFFMRWRGGLPAMFPDGYNKIINSNKYIEISHHAAHAANAFFSSNFNDAFIISIDGGGEECDMEFQNKTHETALALYRGKDNKIFKIKDEFPGVNIGYAWSKITREVFGLSSGPPIGNQCGTVMAMSAVAKNPHKFIDIMRNYVRSPDSNLSELLNLSEDDKFNLAGSLQMATEEYVISLIAEYIPVECKNVCIVGGVALNGLLNNAIFKKFKFNNIYIPPVPYDAGLAIGCCQYIYYNLLDNKRVITNINESSYLGCEYHKDDIDAAIIKNNSFVNVLNDIDDDFVIDLLKNQKIISIFNGKSESGRRALGNRSILADPRKSSMKDLINAKIKHRQWFRPFAPIILQDKVKDWFEIDIESPYMNIIAKFTQDALEKVPAVVHYDGTGRFQSVKQSDNYWMYNFLKKWENKSGVPILLNTSFNDREPIVETPDHAINCFIKTKIDYLYFPEYKILLEKK